MYTWKKLVRSHPWEEYLVAGPCQTYSGIMIVKAAPTSRPIPNTLMTLSRLPNQVDAQTVDERVSRVILLRKTSASSPEITSNARGRYPTPNDAANVATAWPTRVKSGIAELPAVIYRRGGSYLYVATDLQLV